MVIDRPCASEQRHRLVQQPPAAPDRATRGAHLCADLAEPHHPCRGAPA